MMIDLLNDFGVVVYKNTADIKRIFTAAKETIVMVKEDDYEGLQKYKSKLSAVELARRINNIESGKANV